MSFQRYHFARTTPSVLDVASRLCMTSQIIPEALSADAKSLLRCVLVSITCKLPLAVEGENPIPFAF